MPGRMSEDIINRMSGDIPDRISENGQIKYYQMEQIECHGRDFSKQSKVDM